MSLLDLWNNSEKQLTEKNVQQLIAIAGNGKLLDSNKTSNEFRSFLSMVQAGHLSRYAENCLENKFDNSGLALQDIINEIAKRLGFNVKHGRYRGTSKHVGFDGLWNAPTGETIVVEIKTSSTYSIDLGTVAAYREKLIKDGSVPPKKTSILFVVGGFDTGGLEAQIRGSKHAWDIRLISVEALIRLLNLKVSIEDPIMFKKIRNILTPQEFTKVDGIIDLAFSTAEDIKNDQENVPELANGQLPTSQAKQKKFKPSAFHNDCIERIEKKLKVTLVKESRSTFATPNKTTSVVCSVSRHRKIGRNTVFWFAFHPHQKKYLLQADKGFFALGCGSSKLVILIPIKKLTPWLDKLHITDSNKRFYWHMRIQKNKGALQLLTKAESENIPLEKYELK